MYPGSAGGRQSNGNGNGVAGVAVTNVAGTGAGFTGVSPRIEVIGLHYEVTPADLKVSFTTVRIRSRPSELTGGSQNIFSQAGTLVQGPTIRVSV